ncbi:MAG: nuclear transport factor 2 family protein [Deltaproteobacteria bacterium]|nr:nuclear transport factor 2 family protein [Deltaproteobacteria bacterium]
MHNTSPETFLFIIVIASILVTIIYPLQVWAGKGSASSETVSLEARLKRLEDREEIRGLLMDYGRFLDIRDFKSFSELFAETEGEWVGGFGSAKGSKAICELMERTIGKDAPISQSVHLFTNETIQVNGDRASAVTKWIFVVTGESDRPQPYFIGHYEDTMIRENGSWKFLRRVVHSDIPADEKISKGD